MKSEVKVQKVTSNTRLASATGAAGAAEGVVYANRGTLRPAEIDRKTCRGKEQEVEYKMYTEKQSGEGFWSVAPGCGDLSEGMVWISVIRKKRVNRPHATTQIG